VQLVRCREQRQQTLDEFYEELLRSSNFIAKDCGKAMLDLIGALRAWPESWKLWGQTDGYHLCLRPEDKLGPWLVRLLGHGKEYVIDYRMADKDAPWPGAIVSGEAKSLAEAIDRVRIAIDRSGGWPSTKF